jgi:hypothetical protein
MREGHEKYVHNIRGKLEINGRLGKARNKWEKNVKMDLT